MHRAGHAACQVIRRLGRLRAPGGVLAAAFAAFGYVGVVDPNQPGHYPVCPLWRQTGLWCPGCGGLRSAHALVHADLAGALGANAAVVVGCGTCAALWVAWAVRSAQGRSWEPHVRAGWRWAAGALLVAFTIVRNLPSGGWLHP